LFQSYPSDSDVQIGLENLVLVQCSDPQSVAPRLAVKESPGPHIRATESESLDMGSTNSFSTNDADSCSHLRNTGLMHS
jgi:hypothetical protein